MPSMAAAIARAPRLLRPLPQRPLPQRPQRQPHPQARRDAAPRRPRARRWAVGVLAACLCAGLLGTAQAEDTSPPAALPLLRQGYAFDAPEILIRQRLFGLAHGVSLLAAACLDLPAQAAATENAYATWHAAQEATIDRVVAALAAHHFGPRGADAGWHDLARALNLKDSIVPALGDVPLADACASLPEALARPRYDLFHLLEEADAPARPATPAPAAPAPATPDTSPEVTRNPAAAALPAATSPPAPSARPDPAGAAGNAVAPAPTFDEPTAAPTPP